MSWIGKVVRVLRGERLEANRKQRAREDEAIRHALVTSEEKRIQQLEKEAESETDPSKAKTLRSEMDWRRVRLTEAQQVLRGLGL